MIFNSFWQPGLVLGAMEVKQRSMFLKGEKKSARLTLCSFATLSAPHYFAPIVNLFFPLNIPAYSAPFVLSVLSIHDPWGFTAIVNLKLR